MTNAIFAVGDLLADLAALISDRRSRAVRDRASGVVQLNIHAERQSLIEQERMEQWRLWAESNHPGLPISQYSVSAVRVRY